MRRLPGPAGRPLCEGVKTPEAPVDCFGAGREHKLNLLCGLFGVLQQMDVWFCLMQESSAERHCCVRQILIRPIARPPVRAQEFCAFPLTLTYIDVANPLLPIG